MRSTSAVSQSTGKTHGNTLSGLRGSKATPSWACQESPTKRQKRLGKSKQSS